MLKFPKELKLQSRGKKKKIVEQDVRDLESHTGGCSNKSRWGRTNPLKIPPNEYHEDVFRANFPLVDVIQVEEEQPFPVQDKFEGPVLKPEVIREARRNWIRRCVKAHKYLSSEGGGHEKHFAMFEDLGDFTRIAAHEVAKVNKFLSVGLKRKWENVEEPEELEANSGIHLADEPDRQGLMPRRSKCFFEGVACPEAVTGFVDATLSVWDYRALKRINSSSIKTRRVAGILERKWVDDSHKFNAYYQGAFYAVKHCLANLSNGHETPIYILVMAGDYWSYAQLIPTGFVHTEMGLVDSNSMEGFTQHLKLTGQTDTSYQELQRKLDKGTQFLRKHYPDGPNLSYIDEAHLAGTLYICSEWFYLPQCRLGGFNNHDVDRLFHGLLRLVLGDSVMHLSKEEFRKILTRREEFTQDLCSVYEAEMKIQSSS